MMLRNAMKLQLIRYPSEGPCGFGLVTTISAVLVAAAFIVGIGASLGVVLGWRGEGVRLGWFREVLLRLRRLMGLGRRARLGLGPGLVLRLRSRT